MSKVGPGMSPNKQSQTGKVSPTPKKKMFSSKAPKAPSRPLGTSSKHTGK